MVLQYYNKNLKYVSKFGIFATIFKIFIEKDEKKTFPTKTSTEVPGSAIKSAESAQNAAHCNSRTVDNLDFKL